MLSHHPDMFGSHGHSGSGDMMFLVVEGQDSTCHCFNPILLLISKAHGMLCQGLIEAKIDNGIPCLGASNLGAK